MDVYSETGVPLYSYYRDGLISGWQSPDVAIPFSERSALVSEPLFSIEARKWHSRGL